MEKKEFLDMVNLKEELIPIGADNRPGTPISPTSITIHNTNNKRKGADAHAHSRFVREKGYNEYKGKRRSVSWHYTVDDRVALRHLPDRERGLHAGSGTGNGSSIGIEVCMQQGIDQVAADQRAAQLTAYLIVEHGMGPGSVVRHQHWSGKPCPSLLLDDASWEHFLQLVAGYVETLQPSGNRPDDSVPLPDPFEFEGGMCWEDEQP